MSTQDQLEPQEAEEREYVRLNDFDQSKRLEIAEILNYFDVYYPRVGITIEDMIDVGASVEIKVYAHPAHMLDVWVVLEEKVAGDCFLSRAGLLGYMIGGSFPRMGMADDGPHYYTKEEGGPLLIWDLAISADFVWPTDKDDDEINGKIDRLDELLGYSKPAATLLPADCDYDNTLVLDQEYLVQINGTDACLVKRFGASNVSDAHRYIVSNLDHKAIGNIRHYEKEPNEPWMAIYIGLPVNAPNWHYCGSLMAAVMWIYGSTR
jgi:hypothetical protein